MAAGREVYLAEGCLNCHSRYVRAGTRDETLWGPVKPLAGVLKEEPVLMGNRRQGPDLLQVGTRRSRTWLKLHFLDPQAFSAKSAMPSYRYLFDDERGEALLDYLSDVSDADRAGWLEMRTQWRITEKISVGNAEKGAQLFSQNCALCHGEDARGWGKMALASERPPANLREGPWLFSAGFQDDSVGRQELSRIIKYGIPGTDMPGHELLAD